MTRARANPFLVTLGTQSFVYAIALMATQSKTLYSEIPAFNILGQGRIGRIPIAVILFLVLALMLQIVLRNTVYGRYLYAIGQNKEAARLAGIPVDRVLVSTFILCSLLAALGGIVMTSRLNSTVANAGFGFDFESIIAVVLGGTSLFGGSGGALLTVAGVLVLGVLNNTTILLGVPYEVQFIVKVSSSRWSDSTASSSAGSEVRGWIVYSDSWRVGPSSAFSSCCSPSSRCSSRASFSANRTLPTWLARSPSTGSSPSARPWC